MRKPLKKFWQLLTLGESGMGMREGRRGVAFIDRSSSGIAADDMQMHENENESAQKKKLFSPCYRKLESKDIGTNANKFPGDMKRREWGHNCPIPLIISLVRWLPRGRQYGARDLLWSKRIHGVLGKNRVETKLSLLPIFSINFPCWYRIWASFCSESSRIREIRAQSQ